jgi:hypothetical protein
MISKSMFIETFSKYWDMAITGFIGGLAVYLIPLYMKKLRSRILSAIVVFFFVVLLVFIYSVGVWSFS